jgi:hypothetical protein
MIPKLSSGALALALTMSQPANPAVGETEFETVRAATARFQDVKVAIAEGYVRDPMSACEASRMIGWPMGSSAIGVHYFRPELVGMKATPNARLNGPAAHGDPSKPGILIYEPRQDGSLELVAVENLMVKWAWREPGNSEAPRFRGVSYDPMRDNPATKVDEAQMFEPHYDRRVWLFRDRPAGALAPFDSNESCANHGASNASAS